MSRSPAIHRLRGFSSGSRSPPERVEEKLVAPHQAGPEGSHRCWTPSRAFTIVAILTEPPGACAGPVRAIPTAFPVDPPDRVSSRPLARRPPSRVLDATNSLTFVSLCLADEFHRPNCQRAIPPSVLTAPICTGFARPSMGGFGLSDVTSLDTIGRLEVPSRQLTPAVVRLRFQSRGKGNDSESSP
jgi:hypothetical protein